MTRPDNSALVKRRDSHVRTGRKPAVPARVKAAVEIMLDEPGEVDWQKLAARVGYADAAELRRWMTKPQSLRYLRNAKRERLEAINAGNPESLRKIRDESGNSMAQVQAVRALESMEERMDEQAGIRGGQPAPGVVIVIEAADGSTARTIGPPRPALPAGAIIDVEAVSVDDPAG